MPAAPTVPPTAGEPARRLALLESLLEITSADLPLTLARAADLVAAAFAAEKVDVFLYDPSRDTLVSLGASQQPLSALQRKHGLDTLPLANGGRIVEVFRTGRTFLSGRLDEDMHELLGVRETLRVRSTVAVPLDVGGARRGVLGLASTQPDLWTAEEARFGEVLARWVGTVAHRAELVEEIQRSALEHGRKAAAEELVTMVAHDLRAYLSPVGLRLQLLQRRAEAEARPQDARDAQLGLRGIEKITALVGDVLDMGRLDRGMLTVEAEHFELGALIRDLASTLDTPENPVVAEITEEVVVHGDAARVRQCLQNLLANALHYSPRGIPVTVVLSRCAPDRAKVEVIDQGPGVPPELRSHLFDRYVTKRGARGGRGLGLGLFLARRIAELHGGTLELLTAARGARFELRLPADPAPAQEG